jgi:hypothetical protein
MNEKWIWRSGCKLRGDAHEDETTDQRWQRLIKCTRLAKFSIKTNLFVIGRNDNKIITTQKGINLLPSKVNIIIIVKK